MDFPLFIAVTIFLPSDGRTYGLKFPWSKGSQMGAQVHE